METRVFSKAALIWVKDNKATNQWVVMRKKVNLENIHGNPKAYISVDSKYWLYINGKLAVFEGGLNRESVKGGGYYDVVNLADYIIPGENTFAVLCWYWGNEGRNNVSSGGAGFLFTSDDLGLYSDESWKAVRHPAYNETQPPHPAYLFGGYNIGYDANRDIGDFKKPDFDDAGFENATLYSNHFGELVERPIPPIMFSDIADYLSVDEYYSREKNARTCECKLLYNMHLTPFLEINAAGGETIDIRTDRYTVNGGPGGENNLYNGHRVEYICKKGIQEFEALNYLVGEHVIYSIPDSVDVISLGYRESGYDSEIAGTFECDNEMLNSLFRKAARTLKVCMRDNFMDCPDRERGQWIGDVSSQIPQVFYAMDRKADALVKKAITDFINLRKGDVLGGLVPGIQFRELPSQSLNAISEYGMIAEYYKYSGDRGMLELSFDPIVRYLSLWGVGENGLVVKRNGDRYWFDHLNNVDEAVLENCWYYSALKFARFIGCEIGNSSAEAFLDERIVGIKAGFHKEFWNGSFYSSCGVADERANAMAILAELAAVETYPKLYNILISVQNCTPYMEYYVLEALCKIGQVEAAIRRISSRYYNFALNDNTTLWEDFNILGTKNHAWSGGPLTILLKYVAGINLVKMNEKTIVLQPEMCNLKYVNASIMTPYGRFSIRVIRDNGNIVINIDKPDEIKVDRGTSGCVKTEH